ncbi:siderophore iron transporter [Cordyceps fumosorosea ARSEF 2679]|uniref:Siderophore iron transporter n=1 Tax=Cordyceps fumosorosea (strain ARSEF 2679) TaxID=1081104 RepID=A0A168B1J0_CORFA|nr:siderophore iron transporter [Cordyceps fumosorosea ARSEF 2679]OAA69488.1 siderophore iron transporter [Cordyceps fumosorosea ARSEF 2679]
MPVALGPAIAVLICLERKAKHHGLVNMATKAAPRGLIVVVAAETGPKESWGRALLRNWHAIDAVGLVLLGFGWSLLLLPFSLKTYAEHGWRKPSMIAMMVVPYVVYEVKWAKIPSAPRRLMCNKTFIMSIIIYSFYFFAGNMRGLYWSSYVYVAKPGSQQDWVYYGNTMTLALCIFGPITGLLQRWTHRYKAIQLTGLCLKIIGLGIIEVYRRTLFYCLAPALALAFIPLVAACFQTNFYLGKCQNAVTNVGNDGQPAEEREEGQQGDERLPPAASKREAFLQFWGGRNAGSTKRQ